MNQTQQSNLDHRALYRLPWSMPDNAISWLEPTSACNLACEGCYRENIPNSHKSLKQIREEVDTFLRLRKTDGISIAGGDPLMHPEITDIVRMISVQGVKPIINTNGALLTRALTLRLKDAGAAGFTFHVDSRQGRPGWKGKNEIDLNILRLELAETVASAGGLSCAFNSTVYEDTLRFVPDLVGWAADHIDIVNVIVFILYRAAVPDMPFDWFAGGRQVAMDPLVYSSTTGSKVDLKAPDVVAEIRKRFPDFAPCAYLNGTEQPDAFKWLLSGRIGSKGAIHGYVGPKFMELMQAGHHFGMGRYLAYVKPRLSSMGRSMLLFSAFDSGTRRIAANYASRILAHPQELFQGLHYQSVMIIQPVDFLSSGAQSMCDGCPDMTVWNGELVWSCRLEELKQFGTWVRSIPRGEISAR